MGRFVETVGGDTGAAPNPESEVCAAAWTGEGRSTAETLAALYAIEAAQPAIAETKRTGRWSTTGSRTGPAPSTSTCTRRSDHEHAAARRALLEPEIGNGRDEELLQAARDVLAANWALLDGVDRRGLTLRPAIGRHHMKKVLT